MSAAPLIPPPLTLPDDLRAAFDQHQPGLAAKLEVAVQDLRRPCIEARSVRVGDGPLRPSLLGRLVGRKPAPPVLPATASKFGGRPYTEEGEDWNGWHFLGQFDLAAATAVWPGPQFRGLVRLDSRRGSLADGFRAVWFPAPDESKAVAIDVPCVGSRETRIDFSLGWSLPRLTRAWFALLPDDALWDAWNDWEPKEFDRSDWDDCHQLFGWASVGLEEHYGIAHPPAGCSESIDDYEMLLRLTFDNEAGFAWGTNWIYVLVPKVDCARGDFSRLVVTAANS